MYRRKCINFKIKLKRFLYNRQLYKYEFSILKAVLIKLRGSMKKIKWFPLEDGAVLV